MHPSFNMFFFFFKKKEILQWDTVRNLIKKTRKHPQTSNWKIENVLLIFSSQKYIESHKTFQTKIFPFTQEIFV